MKYQTLAIDKLHPDPNQPRKYLDEDALKEMAISIKNEGLINPIEADEKFVIITGERRWRASKIAGLKEVPVRLLENISAKDRFIRQMQENIHQDTMSAWDTAEALDKIRKTILTPAAVVKKGSGGFRHGIRGIKEIHDLLGIPETTIGEFLDLLGVTGKLKEALKDPSFQRTKVVSIKEAPKKHQEKLEQIVVTQKSIPRDTVRQIATALRRADKYGEEASAIKLLNENYEGLTTLETLSKINKIVPDEESRIKEPAEALKFISEKIIEFMGLLDEHPLKSFDGFHRPFVERDLTNLGAYLARYLGLRKGVKKTEIKLIESTKTI